MLHREDMIDAFRRTIDRRAALPPETEILIGEPDAMGYDALQDELGRLIQAPRIGRRCACRRPLRRPEPGRMASSSRSSLT